MRVFTLRVNDNVAVSVDFAKFSTLSVAVLIDNSIGMATIVVDYVFRSLTGRRCVECLDKELLVGDTVSISRAINGFPSGRTIVESTTETAGKNVSWTGKSQSDYLVAKISGSQGLIASIFAEPPGTAQIDLVMKKGHSDISLTAATYDDQDENSCHKLLVEELIPDEDQVEITVGYAD